jgi:hypothetical protein
LEACSSPAFTRRQPQAQLRAGKAFIYDIGTEIFLELEKPGALSLTAYGIWHNGGASYTIAGGFSEVNTSGLDRAYLMDWDSATQTTSHWTAFNYGNDSAIITHFDGITGDGLGSFNLTGDCDWIGPGETEWLGFFAKRLT